MALFKKKKIAKPTFSELHGFQDDEAPELPAYEPAKRPVEKQEFSIPKRETKMPHHLAAEEETIREPTGKGPLFVKITQYKAALRTIEELKEKIEEAEKTMTALNELKAKEDEQLDKWKEELEGIKDRLMSIDRDLFEG